MKVDLLDNLRAQIRYHQESFAAMPSTLVITLAEHSALERNLRERAYFERLRMAGYDGRSLFGIPLTVINVGSAL